MSNKNSLTSKREVYHRLISNGFKQVNPEYVNNDPINQLVEEFKTRREAGEKVSIRQFCGQNKISQRQFEQKLNGNANNTNRQIDKSYIDYYNRPEVQEAIYSWLNGRRTSLHFRQGLIGLGIRKPSDVGLLAAASTTKVPTFHASVGKYSKDKLSAFDLVAEVDFKGDWETCFKITKPLVQSLYNSKLEFLVKFSGHSSAHVLVPCRGENYKQAADAFIKRIPSSVRYCGKLDLSFRFPQHFIRVPYALHEKTGLVSLPLTMEQFDNFNLDMAKPENVDIDLEKIEKVLQADNMKWLL